jgi:arginine deiminase
VGIAVSGRGERGNRGGIVSYGIGADSEIGCLHAALMHRPGRELRRITPRTRSLLGFDGLPWVAKAQQEHDLLVDVLTRMGTEVIYFAGLLQDVLEYADARDEAIASVLANSELGAELAPAVSKHLDALPPEDLASVLIAGLTSTELRAGHGLVFDLLDAHDFVIDPLPNLVFSRDASAWVGDQVVVGALPGPRRRETDLLAIIYRRHPRFIGVRRPYQQSGIRLDCGDVLLLSPGVVAVGVGPASTPAGAELLARHLLEAGIAHHVLVVPMTRCGTAPHLYSSHLDTSRLDTICTVLDHGVVLMAPALAFTMTALTITLRNGELRVSSPQPYLEAAARAMDIDRLTVIETGIDSVGTWSGQWDDGGNALAVGDRTIVCDERSAETNARLTAAGFEVVNVPYGELGRVRGGPRAMCVPMARDPVAIPGRAPADREHTRPACGRPPAQRAHSTDSAVPVTTAGVAPEQPVKRGELAPLR